jgi:predicted nucleic acid-binding protein
LKKRRTPFSGVKTDDVHCRHARPCLASLEMRKLRTGYSIHDAVIVATAKLLDAPIITRDEQIRKLGDAKVIW